MKIYVLVFFIYWLAHGYCTSNVHIGYQVSLAIPTTYSKGFIGRAFLMETDNQMTPNFRAAISVEAINEKYTCSLDVFLGDVKVWSSGHLSQFYTIDKCALQLTQYGDLQLKGQDDKVGWKAGTSGQGVKRLHLLGSGNLVLVDALNMIKWQSFNFPTNIMLWGQRLSSRTRLTSFPSNSSLSYSFEIQYDKIALYLYSGKSKYSYWEYTPLELNDLNITYVELTSNALEIFNNENHRIGRIKSDKPEPVRFLALGNNTGNLGFYYYSAEKGKFEASYQALNTTCDLPLACRPYGICTFSEECSCIRLIKRGDGLLSDCAENVTEGLCGRNESQMLELQGVTSVLRSNPYKVNVSKEVCANLCLNNCTCVAALHFSVDDSEDDPTKSGQCYSYGLVRGVKQIERDGRLSYMVKVPKGTDQDHGEHSHWKKWIPIVVGVVDGVVVLLVLGGIGYYVIRKRRKSCVDTDPNN
ncbi:G-type lectin S-receptor-like serine/threonine-protein kinase SD2-5 [Nicotiana tabacum]|uniref:G-type lectin S-receptor-like serine/threonine-protein kinase SD2-5 n=2 Tax=Nicotiana TaxID=4085 RepID=A0A1S4BY19_TOBAC|nr:PREDICTED: G-type lectin S-receptor-like serine/threonine-protein kinase SD2-5 [Nicotiana sylvestris]XP_016493801.1 PREDICTED: G-type lectin S-receptor-like serine/threonine-protein kinase SD2-5 [Nicotiana tabacum]